MPSDNRVERNVETDALRSHIDLTGVDPTLTEGDIEQSLGSAREVLERHLIEDHTLRDGRTVRQVFYELTDIAIQALADARRRAAT
ncbi:MAG TPA: hypothetical protein VHK89_01725 [Actinomycetota bacterium]|jgi:hypothetical protein|nr:hypothetical protein [Actinomycetota bacterium]